jgi:AraC-like DNA-binding protein/uncharacterized protein (DUF486 family)
MTVITGAEIWNIIILLGAIQGYVVSTLLFVSKKNNKISNRLLATLILLMTLACTNLYMTEAWYTRYRIVRIIEQVFPFVMAMPIGPLIYFYVQSLLKPGFRLTKAHKWHFSAVIIDWVPTLIVWVFLAGLLTGVLQREDGRGWGDFIDSFNTYGDIPRWLSITVYLLLTKRLLTRFAHQNNHYAASRLEATGKWIRQFINAFLVFQGIWLVFLVPYIIPAVRGPLLDTMSYYPIYIPLAILIYWLGFKGYLHTQADAGEKLAEESTPVSGPQKVIVPSLTFTEEEANRYIAALKKAMEADKLYLAPSLNVSSVSEHTGIAQKTVSFILNNHLHKSFNEFVNEYRIDEVKKRLLDKTYEHLTISGIALECGFNSQATFQRAFKNSTGVSPKEYVSLKLQRLA